jgi:hypothetical protein
VKREGRAGGAAGRGRDIVAMNTVMIMMGSYCHWRGASSIRVYSVRHQKIKKEKAI